MLDITGQRFGKLTAVKFAETKGERAHWLCRCDCGNETVKSGKSLRNGSCQSCGCILRQIVIERNKGMASHGLSSHPIYAIWWAMQRRCYDKLDYEYKNYGQRGIKVCDRWHDLVAFYDDNIDLYEKGLQLDRKDNDGDYTPDNTRWVKPTVQSRNKRNNVFVEYEGRSMIVADWAREFKIRPNILRGRIKRGFPFEEAVSRPVIPRKTHKRKKQFGDRQHTRNRLHLPGPTRRRTGAVCHDAST